ncbi:MAG: hypothetical protein HYX69_00510 [Planctomycetia bacterium]|nr:hypothetical protein [Planctomycetia bacterium]
MERVTVAVPRAVALQMKAVGRAVNWSQVASDAFAAKVAEVSASKAAKDVEDVVTRLRHSQRKRNGPNYLAGLQAGTAWARNVAEADQLSRLETIFGGFDAAAWDDLHQKREGTAAGDAFLVAWAPATYKEGSRRRQFWTDEAKIEDQNQLDSWDFIRGFCDAALDLWTDVKERI